MKKIFIILTIGIVLCNSFIASSNITGDDHLRKPSLYFTADFQVEWNKTFGGTGYDLGTGIKPTDDGGFVFIGIKDAVFYDNEGDCWLVKIDGNGNIEWEKTFGGINSEIASDVFVTNDNGYVLVFSTRSFGAGDMDICVIKTDSNGNEVWNKTYGGLYHDQATSIKQTSDNGYIITAMTQSYGDNEAWLLKINNNGIIQWSKTYGNNDDTGEYFMEALQTNNGGYIAAGRDYLNNDANSDIFIVKTDVLGVIEWEKRLGGEYPDGCIGITQIKNGGYILTGQSSQTYNTPEDISLFKINSFGNETWKRYYGGPYFDTGTSVLQCLDGGYLIAGEFSRNSQNTDAIILKTDSNGYEEWRTILGGKGSDGFLEIHKTSDNGYICVGFTESYGAGSCDIWIVKFSSFENNPPHKPLRPSGQSSGNINDEYTYNSSTTDPDGDEIYYLWDWGDGTVSEWYGPYASNEECNASHTWISKGNYKIKVKSKDNNSAESDWSDPLLVTMPKNKAFSFNHNLLKWLFERHPNLFPVIQKIIQRLGLQ